MTFRKKQGSGIMSNAIKPPSFKLLGCEWTLYIKLVFKIPKLLFYTKSVRLTNLVGIINLFDV